jgi:beta-glucosidase
MRTSVTIFDGIRRRAGASTTVEFAPGVRVVQRLFPSIFDIFGDNQPADPADFDENAELRRAVDLTGRSDVAVVVVGEWQSMAGENASRSSLELPGRQLELLQAVAATGTPVVVVVLNGRPLDLRWAAEHVPAILDVWYPGTPGGTAVANLLFGDVSPGGKLPFTWPRTVGHVPMTYAHTRSHDPQNQGGRYWDEASTPLFPFGHGLSYGQFSYADLSLSKTSITQEETLTVSVSVTNTADVAADEVVQIYLHQRHGAASRPIRELKAFSRTHLAAGETRRLTFTIGPDQRRYWSAATRSWVLDTTTFDVWAGGDSTAQLTTTFEVANV